MGLVGLCDEAGGVLLVAVPLVLWLRGGARTRGEQSKLSQLSPAKVSRTRRVEPHTVLFPRHYS